MEALSIRILVHLLKLFGISINGLLKLWVILKRIKRDGLLAAKRDIFGRLLVMQVWYSHVLLPGNLLRNEPAGIILTV